MNRATFEAFIGQLRGAVVERELDRVLTVREDDEALVTWCMN